MNKISKPILPAAESDYDRRLNTVLDVYFFGLSNSIGQGADGYLTTVTSVSTSYAASLNDSVILVNATSGNKTITLPAATDSTTKRMSVKKTDASANLVIVDPAGTALIDNVTASTLSSALASMDVITDGTNWWKL